MQNLKKLAFSLMLVTANNFLNSDSFQYNSYNNHGVVGLINMPTARFYDMLFMELQFMMEPRSKYI